MLKSVNVQLQQSEFQTVRQETENTDPKGQSC